MTADLVWAGDESLRPLLIPIDSIQPHPDNPRRGDVKRIGESLRRFGQKRPILVQQSTGFIVAGNHTWLAAGAEGWSSIAAVVSDMSDDDALAYLITDNRTAELGGYDDEGLIAVLTRLQDAGNLVGTGYTPDEVDDAISNANRLAETDPEDFQGGHSESPETLAAREAARAAAPIMREVVLMYDPETYVRFGGFVKILQKEYGTNGVIETVYRAVETEAKRLNSEGGEP